LKEPRINSKERRAERTIDSIALIRVKNSGGAGLKGK
jgi:hypothetical protein